MSPPIQIDDVLAAAETLRGVAHHTPILTSRTLDERTGARALLKAENLQRGGAFKFRGAYNRIAAMTPEEREAGVVTSSSGNHAQAVALAASLLGTRATVLMPADAPASKVDATAGYGAEVIAFDRYADDRHALTEQLAAERGAVLVHAYDDPLVMAGQGTAALELIVDVEPPELLLVPVGGGGLISGCATVARALAPECRVVGVEPEAGDDMRRSLAAGERVEIPVPRTIADGQAIPQPGELTFEVIRERVDDVVTVSDEEILDAMAFAFERMRTVLEPSGASALAALLAGRADADGRRVGVILSGGNVDVARFCSLLSG